MAKLLAKLEAELQHGTRTYPLALTGAAQSTRRGPHALGHGVQWSASTFATKPAWVRHILPTFPRAFHLFIICNLP